MTSFNADALNKIATSNAFLNAAGNVTHGEGEKIETLDFGGNGNAVITDSDGETFELSLETVAAELGMSVDELKAQLEGDEAIKGVETTAPADKAAEAGAAAEVAATDEIGAADVAKFEKEIADLTARKETQMEAMTALEESIEGLAKDIEEKIKEAAAKQEAKVEEHKKEVQDAIERNVAEYIADKKAGKNVTQDDLKSGINSDLAALPDIANVVSNLFVAQSELNVLDSQIAQLKGMANDIADIDSQISKAQSNLQIAKEAEQAAQAAQQASRSCDPIGFKDADGNQFDFIVMDEDGFNTTSDFLGAEGQWQAMTALDVKGGEDGGDGIVTMDELREANIGMVMTDKDGNQKVMNADEIAEMFGEDFSIDLSSYVSDADGAKYDGITDADADGNGVIDQDLQGTFKVSTAAGELEGYNTLDDQEWLAEKCNLEADVMDETGAIAGTLQKPAAADGEAEVGEEDPMKVHNDFIETYELKASELRSSLEDQWALYNLDEELLELIDKNAGDVAAAEVAGLEEELEPAKEEGDDETVDGADEPKADDKVGEDETAALPAEDGEAPADKDPLKKEPDEV